MKKALITMIASACCLLACSGCKSPEQRAMDQFDKAMKMQAYMMEHMQETMERTARQLEQTDK
jgi:pyruvate-formate lyase-activating enzyme